MLTTGDHSPGVRILARGPALNDQMMEQSRAWRHLLSVRDATTAPNLRASLPNNRTCVAEGLQMTSLFDWNGTTSAARTLLRREQPGIYYFSWAPTNVKVIDMAEVILQGPDDNGHPTVIAVRTPEIVRAALNYWKVVLALAEPAWGGTESVGPTFTPRQRRILSLLGSDMGDQAIADLLGVSLRTVRSDIARILDSLGVSSRFAAGLQLGLINEDLSS